MAAKLAQKGDPKVTVIAGGPHLAARRANGLRLRNDGREVVIRGPNVTAGYEANPEANAKAFTNGWFRTGDQGAFDEDGFLTLTDASRS